MKSGEHMRIGIDGQKLTPDQDRKARALGERIGLFIAMEAKARFTADTKADADQLREYLLLTPYALMYCINASRAAVKKVDATGFENLIEGIL